MVFSPALSYIGQIFPYVVSACLSFSPFRFQHGLISPFTFSVFPISTFHSFPHFHIFPLHLTRALVFSPTLPLTFPEILTLSSFFPKSPQLFPYPFRIHRRFSYSISSILFALFNIDIGCVYKFDLD